MSQRISPYCKSIAYVLHVGAGDAKFPQRVLDLLDYAFSVLWVLDIRLSHDLYERGARAVVVDQGVVGLVDGLGCVLGVRKLTCSMWS